MKAFIIGNYIRALILCGYNIYLWIVNGINTHQLIMIIIIVLMYVYCTFLILNPKLLKAFYFSVTSKELTDNTMCGLRVFSVIYQCALFLFIAVNILFSKI